MQSTDTTGNGMQVLNGNSLEVIGHSRSSGKKLQPLNPKLGMTTLQLLEGLQQEYTSCLSCDVHLAIFLMIRTSFPHPALLLVPTCKSMKLLSHLSCCFFHIVRSKEMKKRKPQLPFIHFPFILFFLYFLHYTCLAMRIQQHMNFSKDWGLLKKKILSGLFLLLGSR